MLHDLEFDIQSLRDAYAGGVKPADVIKEVFRRIAEVNDPAIFIHLCDEEEVLQHVQALPAQSDETPLWGIPFVAKDNIDVGGIPTTAACPAFAYIPQKDAFVVSELRAAGALLIGKTNLDQFATGLVGVRSPFGTPRNAVDPAIVPGGSSSGSAVAVGHGFVSFSLGTDTAGSGRVPAALNDVVGLKPSLGALSARGVVPACRSLDTVSIFAKCIEDAHAVFDVACVYDPQDAFSRKFARGPLQHPRKLPRIGIPDDNSLRFFGDVVQEACFRRDIARMVDLGWQIVPLDFTPLYAVADMLYEGAWVAERYTVIEGLLKSDPDAIHPTTAKIIRAAEKLSAADAFRGMYRLKELSRDAEGLLAEIDYLCVPTIPTFYSCADLAEDPVTPNSNLGTYTNFVNLLDMSGLSMPTEKRSDGRPGSVTFIGKSGDDTALAGLALAYDGRLVATTSKDAVSSAQEHEIELAVCGAHMSGMALNHELTSRGGRKIVSTRTAPRYRLYALAGGPPERPGLLRIEKGSAIDLEIWALPKSRVGDFLAGIPAPLAIGTVEMADGSKSHGFLVETAGIQGAEDITYLGGWRQYIAQKAQLSPASA